MVRRLFAKHGYRVALVARNADHLNNAAAEINNSGGEVSSRRSLNKTMSNLSCNKAAAFPVKSYTYPEINALFKAIRAHNWPSQAKAEIRVALWNASHGVWKNFLDVTEEDVRDSVEGNIVGPFAFSREAILAFKENELDDRGRRGTLLFTGATASIRGNVVTSAFAAGKHALRALSQSLAKEFGKQNIHVSLIHRLLHIIIHSLLF